MSSEAIKLYASKHGRMESRCNSTILGDTGLFGSFYSAKASCILSTGGLTIGRQKKNKGSSSTKASLGVPN